VSIEVAKLVDVALKTADNIRLHKIAKIEVTHPKPLRSFDL